MKETMKLEILDPLFWIVRLEKNSIIPEWISNEVFFSITKTAEELSVVCLQDKVPDGITCERGWKAIKVAAILDFSLVGIISRISKTLAEGGISIFVISTYDTDYILVRNRDIENATGLLINRGYKF